jgi:hypothetical protein
MKPISSKIFWQIFITSIILAGGLAIYQTAQQISSLGIILWRSKWIFLPGGFALNIVVGVFILLQLSRDGGDRWVKRLEFDKTNKRLGLILIVAGFSLVWVFRLSLFGDTLPQFAPIFWVFLWASLVQALGLKLLIGTKWHFAFALVVLVQGVIYQVYGSLTIVSMYPFSIGYSEASRHYYASMFHAKSLYGLDLPFPFLHPTRYMLMSLPFLVKGLPLWFHRLWQSLLWIVLTGTSSILLARRLRLKGWMYFLVAAWAYIYFLQGAVYYHLQVCVILILAGVSTKKFWRSLIFVLLASFWAGMSRVNWFPVPAMLAIAIYILETAINDKGWRYWVTPFIWGIAGLVAAVFAQFFYIQISGNADVRNFGSSFTSDLLWDRLLPNDIFSGVLIGVALVSAPLIISLFQNMRGRLSNVHPLRWLALLGLVLVLLLGGLVVSVKIGGGGDLHNMDAFLVMLALIASAFFAGRVETEDGKTSAWGEVHAWVIAAALLVPLSYALPRVGSFYQYDQAGAQSDIQTLQKYAEESNGEVLFVTERQLFTFGELKNIPLIPEYEQIELMEMAMSGNRVALEKFYADLNKHRFAIIIAEEQKFTLQKKGAFKEENNAWVRYVGAPILCAYKPVKSLTTTNIQIFVPRSNRDCKNPFDK